MIEYEHMSLASCCLSRVYGKLHFCLQCAVRLPELEPVPTEHKGVCQLTVFRDDGVLQPSSAGHCLRMIYILYDGIP